MCFVLTDNVTLQIDGVLYLRILDPFKVRIRNASKCWSDCVLLCVVILRSIDINKQFCLFPGQLRCWGSRICRHTAGADHHAFRTWQTHAGQSVQGKDRLVLCLTLSRLVIKRLFHICLNLCFSYFFYFFLLLRKGSPSMPTWSTPSTKHQTSGESVASVTKSRIYMFHLVSKSQCRCRWGIQNEYIAGLINNGQLSFLSCQLIKGCKLIIRL